MGRGWWKASGWVVCGALMGCGTASPTMRVVDAGVVERTADGVVMRFVVEGENPNEVELPLRNAVYRVELDGREVFRGERSAEATLRRRGAQQFELPAVVKTGPEGLAGGVRRYRVSGSIGYTGPGALAETLFDLGVRRPTVGFEGRGEIDLGSGG